MSNPMQINRVALTLYLCNWIFGLGVIQYPLGTERPTISLVYSSICIVSYCSFSAVAYPYVINWSISTTVSLVPIKILFFSNIILTVSVIILAWYRSEGIFNSVQKCMMINDMMEGIGVQMSLKRMRKSYMWRLAVSAILVAIVITVNAVLIAMEKAPVHAKIAAGISFIYPMVIMFIAEMTFLIIVRKVYKMFVILNKTLKSMLTDESEAPRHKYLIGPLVSEENKLPLDTVSCTVNAPATTVTMTKKIHLELLKLSEQVNDIYGTQILLSIIVAFGVITGNIYVSYMLLQSGSVKRTLAYKSTISSIVWTSYYAFKISNFARACTCCKETAIETGDCINKFYDEPFANEEIKSEIRDFNVQLIQRPVRFTAAGCIALDTSLMQIMVSSITTYLMILIQLGSGQT